MVKIFFSSLSSICLLIQISGAVEIKTQCGHYKKQLVSYKIQDNHYRRIYDDIKAYSLIQKSKIQYIDYIYDCQHETYYPVWEPTKRLKNPIGTLLNDPLDFYLADYSFLMDPEDYLIGSKPEEFFTIRNVSGHKCLKQDNQDIAYIQIPKGFNLYLICAKWNKEKNRLLIYWKSYILGENSKTILSCSLLDLNKPDEMKESRCIYKCPDFIQEFSGDASDQDLKAYIRQDLSKPAS